MLNLFKVVWAEKAKILVLSSIILYILGITQPAFVTTRFFFLKETITIINSIWILFDNKNFFLGVIILLFTIIFPIFKYSVMVWLVVFPMSGLVKKFYNYLLHLGKWSMLDVFVIALVIILIKFGQGMFSVQIRSGTIFFALSVITSIVASSALKKSF